MNEALKDRALIIASKWAEQDVEFFLDMAKKDFEIWKNETEEFLEEKGEQ